MRVLYSTHPSTVVKRIGIEAYRAHGGMLCVPAVRKAPKECADYGVPWALDNSAYSNFDPAAFVRAMADYRHYPNCLWVAVPDVVANAEATYQRFMGWRLVVKEMGYPLALVAQDGMEDMQIDWSLFDCLFIGGSTKWKLGQAVIDLAGEAKRRGKLLHMGRVNSDKRLKFAQSIGCDTVDGTGYVAFPDRAIEPIRVLNQPYLQRIML